MGKIAYFRIPILSLLSYSVFVFFKNTRIILFIGIARSKYVLKSFFEN